MMLISFPLVLGAEVNTQQQQEATNIGILKFIQQESLKQTSELKQFVIDQTKLNQNDIQDQIEYNKKIIYADFDKKIKNATIKLSLAVFVSIVASLITYRLIMMQIKQKFIKKELRTEYKSL